MGILKLCGEMNKAYRDRKGLGVKYLVKRRYLGVQERRMGVIFQKGTRVMAIRDIVKFNWGRSKL